MLYPARIEQQFQALRRVEPEVVLALRADAPVGVQVLLPHNRPAIFALGPQPFGLHATLVGRRGLFDSLFSRLNQAIKLESRFPGAPAQRAAGRSFYFGGSGSRRAHAHNFQSYVLVLGTVPVNLLAEVPGDGAWRQWHRVIGFELGARSYPPGS